MLDPKRRQEALRLIARITTTGGPEPYRNAGREGLGPFRGAYGSNCSHPGPSFVSARDMLGLLTVFVSRSLMLRIAVRTARRSRAALFVLA
jgi:hypothetical protein